MIVSTRTTVASHRRSILVYPAAELNSGNSSNPIMFCPEENGHDERQKKPALLIFTVCVCTTTPFPHNLRGHARTSLLCFRRSTAGMRRNATGSELGCRSAIICGTQDCTLCAVACSRGLKQDGRPICSMKTVLRRPYQRVT